MFGTAAANSATVARLKTLVGHSGLCLGPDDVFLGLRGLRTLAVRLDRHYRSGMAVARWLAFNGVLAPNPANLRGGIRWCVCMLAGSVRPALGCKYSGPTLARALGCGVGGSVRLSPLRAS